MDQVNITKTIIKTLDDFYTTNFKEAQLSPRHYDFSSVDYDFSFPNNISDDLTKQSLQKKIESFLNRNADKITKNEHFLFDANGDLWQK